MFFPTFKKKNYFCRPKKVARNPTRLLCETETVLKSEIFPSLKLSNFAGWKNILESLWCRYNSIPLRGTQLSILRFWPLLCVVDVQNISCKFVKLRLLYKVKRYFILYKMTCVPAFNLRTIPVMNFIPVFNYYATFRVKLVMVFIQDICDISKISKNCNCDIWIGRSTWGVWI